MAKDTIVRFVSPKYRSLKLVMKPGYSKEVGGRILAVNGTSVRFKDGLYETENEAEIEFLRGHENNVANAQRSQKSPIFEEVDVKDLDEKLKEQESLEEREARLAEREAAVEEKEAKLGRKTGDKKPATKKAAKKTATKKAKY